MVFIHKQEVLSIHRNLINTFGGSHGLRDEGALESALSAAENRFHYEDANVAICAATYAYHLTKAHAFIDGNKRIAALVAELFLLLNQASLNATNDEMIQLFLQIAHGELPRSSVESRFEGWVK